MCEESTESVYTQEAVYPAVPHPSSSFVEFYPQTEFWESVDGDNIRCSGETRSYVHPSINQFMPPHLVQVPTYSAPSTQYYQQMVRQTMGTVK